MRIMVQDIDCGDMTLGRRKELMAPVLTGVLSVWDEPLDQAGWEQVYDAYRAFRYQVRLIVKRARAHQPPAPPNERDRG